LSRSEAAPFIVFAELEIEPIRRTTGARVGTMNVGGPLLAQLTFAQQGHPRDFCPPIDRLDC
jgi:hypothetical protein